MNSHECTTCIKTSSYSFVCSILQIVDIREVGHLKGLKLLRALNLSNNPIEVSMV